MKLEIFLLDVNVSGKPSKNADLAEKKCQPAKQDQQNPEDDEYFRKINVHRDCFGGIASGRTNVPETPVSFFLTPF